eukprot:SAG22_NODE_6172_length_890_cov_1.515803_2_plen_57_part_01
MSETVPFLAVRLVLQSWDLDDSLAPPAPGGQGAAAKAKEEEGAAMAGGDVEAEAESY